MAATTSRAPKSPGLMPIPRSSLPSIPRKGTVALSAPSKKGHNPRPALNISNTNGLTKSQSQLPVSPVQASSTGYSNRLSKLKPYTDFKTPSRPKTNKTPTAISPATIEKMLFSSTSGDRPQTPSSEIKQTSSPPPAPVKPSISRADSTTTSAPAPKPPGLPSNEGSPYIGPHIGDPCTTNSLDHLLSCSHKIITYTPDLCASNCIGNHGSYANPRSVNEHFACLACITAAAPTKHAERVRSFRDELEATAKATMKPFPGHWIGGKMKLMEKAWKDVEWDEMVGIARRGRFCYPVYVEPEFEGVVAVVVEEVLREKGRKLDEAARALVDRAAA